jgi:hypothetical protein
MLHNRLIREYYNVLPARILASTATQEQFFYSVWSAPDSLDTFLSGKC